ncbi:MAG: hypothetical protein ACC645_23320 [Pirellulales bacterium]
MASETDHITLANKNHAALAYLLNDHEQFPEWITTISFYKAIQVVEAVFWRLEKRNSNSHSHRLNRLKHGPYVPIFKHFRFLWNASMVARYLHESGSDSAFSSFTDFMPTDAVVERVVKKRLKSVEDNCVSMLSDSGKGSLMRVGDLPSI